MVFERYFEWALRLVDSRAAAHDEELTREIATHLEMHIEDNIRDGMCPSQARRYALIKLGGLRQAIEACHDVRRPNPLFNLLTGLLRFVLTFNMRRIGR